MKKFFTMILVLVAALVFAGCQGNEFKTDGEFTAFEWSIHQKGPQVTWVTVTVENGKITKYFIDARQGTAEHGPVEAQDGTVSDKWTFAWNAKTKKELKEEYGMISIGGSEKEWYEQAQLIEAAWLKDGVEGTDFSKIAGVTISDGGYTKLAKEAIANAKAGKVVAFEHTMNYGIPNIVWVELTLEKGKAKTLVVDTIQATADNASAETGLVWNTKSKQQLGYFYEMFWPQFGEHVTDANLEAYKTWLKDNNKLEWFEQVKLVTDDILANGLKAEPTTPVAGVTITTSDYYKLIADAYKAVGLN